MIHEHKGRPERLLEAAESFGGDKPTVATATRRSARRHIKPSISGSRPRRWVITHRATSVDRHGALLLRGRDVRDVLERYGFTPRWSAAGRGWVVDDRHLPDVAAVAELETSGYRVVHADNSECCCGINLNTDCREVGGDPSEVVA